VVVVKKKLIAVLADDFLFYCTKAGAVKKMSGSIRFEKTENGWRAVEGLPKTP